MERLNVDELVKDLETLDKGDAAAVTAVSEKLRFLETVQFAEEYRACGYLNTAKAFEDGMSVKAWEAELCSPNGISRIIHWIDEQGLDIADLRRAKESKDSPEVSENIELELS